ncbi:DNA-binding protein [Segatella copri]|uniref:HU family DNA-binding protein n=1 Tax=Segatella copri TaxID=165179 RepID=UPI0019338A8E|nr:DNA-binding protein [Segatella copri]MBM0144971.1 DNA-binding protein [Segatella copri]
MIQVVLKQNKNKKMPNAYGLYYAYPVVNETYDLDKLAEHMSSHNTPFSKGAIKGMLTDAVNCIRELNLQGIAVKINDLAIFSLGIKNKMGAKSIGEWSAAKNIAGVKSRARATGNLISASLNLDATIKRVDKGVIVIDGGGTDGGGTDGGGSNGGGNTPSGGSSTGDNTSGGTGKDDSGTSGGDSGSNGDNEHIVL